MAMAHFKKLTDKHIKQTKPKHYKYALALAVSVTLNILLIIGIICHP